MTKRVYNAFVSEVRKEISDEVFKSASSVRRGEAVFGEEP
jgi:hypothetical protein